MENKDMNMIQGMFETIMTQMTDMKQELQQEIQGTKQELRQEMQGIKQELRQEIQGTKQELSTKIDQSENRIKALLENDTHKRIQILHEGYQLLSEKVSTMEQDLQETKDNTEILNALKEFHR